MSVTVLDRAVVTVDSERMVDREIKRRDPEVPERARRRRFTAKYKLEVLTAYGEAAAGEKGAILRREGLYSSHVTEWRRARDSGALAGLAAPRGRRPVDARDAQIRRLTREKSVLERELVTSRFVVDVQAKLQALLEKLSESADTEPTSAR